MGSTEQPAAWLLGVMPLPCVADSKLWSDLNSPLPGYGKVQLHFDILHISCWHCKMFSKRSQRLLARTGAYQTTPCLLAVATGRYHNILRDFNLDEVVEITQGSLVHVRSAASVFVLSAQTKPS